MSASAVYRLIVALLWASVAFGSAELALRATGYAPLSPQTRASILSTPQAYQKDSQLGWTLKPGPHRFAPVSPQAPWTSATIESLGNRSTEPQPLGHSGQTILFLGDSFTFGDGLNDNQTYPWLVQQALPRSRVLNFAVPGYGTCQALLELQNLSNKIDLRGAVIIYGFSQFQERRNLPDPRIAWEFASVSTNGEYYAPQCSLDERGALAVTDAVTFTAPAVAFTRRSAVLRRAMHSGLDAWGALMPQKARPVTFELLRQMREVAGKIGAAFYVLLQRFTTARDEYEQFLAGQKISAIDGSHPGEDRPEMQLAGDRHPNAAMNAVFAERVLEELHKGS